MTSARVDELDPPAEVFYRRLMSKVDDHGLYDARPTVLRAALYPLRVDRTREADISRWMAACQKAGLIALYEVAGKPYVQMLDTRWTARADPKFPPPSQGSPINDLTHENSCEQVKTPVSLDVVVVGDVVGDVDGHRGKPRRTQKTPIPDGFSISPRVSEWAAKKGYKHLPARLEHFVSQARAKAYRYADWDDAFMNAIRNDWARLNGVPEADAPKRVAL